VLPGPAPRPGDCPGTRVYEIPLVIQDHAFNDDGSLFYPDSRGLPPQLASLYRPKGRIPPIWVPMFLGDAMVVNGRTWPYLEVEQRRYRFRILNACTSRFLVLKLSNGVPFWQIGADAGGFLPAPVQRDTLQIGPAERVDVIVDFSGVQAGTEILLLNSLRQHVPDDPSSMADPETTGEVMQLRVVSATSVDTSTPPDQLKLPLFTPHGDPDAVRRLSLTEEVVAGVGPRVLLQGVVESPNLTPKPLHFDEPISETPAAGATEIWELYNFTGMPHPIHIHHVDIQIVERQPFNGSTRPPDPGETGFKDTIIATPNEITRLKMRFDTPGVYIWHCHILEHEDNEMMRPLHVGPIPDDLPEH
jgi:spore coat protein A, manganese oxidase